MAKTGDQSLKLPVSAVTIRRPLCEAKLSARSPHKVPLLKRYVLLRLHFAKENIGLKGNGAICFMD
jgi:hypothetical protein